MENNGAQAGIARHSADAERGMSREADAKIDQAAHGIRDAAESARQAAGQTAQNTAEAAGKLRARLQDIARDLSEQASQVGAQLYEQTREAGQQAGEQIKQRPLAAVMLTGFVGVVLGYVLARASQPEPSPRDYAARMIPRRYR